MTATKARPEGRPSPSKLAVTWAEGKVLGSRGLRAWIHSLRLAAPECEIVVCAPSPTEIAGAKTHVVSSATGRTPLQRRWTAYIEAIKEAPDAELVLLSDSRDLVFQGDPFAAFLESRSREQGAGSTEILVASEHHKCGEHPWCMEKEKELRSKIGGEPDLDRIEINGGIQLGTREAMWMFALAMEAGTCANALSTDQAFMNWWIYRRCPVPWQFAPADWYLHGEAVKTGRLKMEVRDGFAFVQNGSVEPRRVTVWHQYDRTGHTAVCWNYHRPPMRAMKLLMVVSHFDEPLKWLSDVEHEAFVVSKSPKPPPETRIVRPNIGREAETWAWFFATHYDELPELLVCLQGKPFDHVTRDVFASELSKILNRESFSYTPLSTPGHGNWTGIDTPDHKGIPMQEWWTRLFKTAPPLRWYTPYGGQFAVHRDAVRSRPRAFWEMIVSECKTREDACTLERLWQFIFTGVP